jgi:hypothetical protein
VPARQALRNGHTVGGRVASRAPLPQKRRGFLSLVIPGTSDKPGTLVTFVSSPASSGIFTTGEAVDINGVTGRLEESVQADGTPVSSITMQIGDVSIGAHGNTDPDTLLKLMESIRLLNDNEWTQLVAEIDAD